MLGLAAAVSFGISAPLAKGLLANVEPVMLAGLLYVGAFVGLTLVSRRSSSEATLRRSDAPRMTAMIIAGGVVAPVLLLLGLERVSGVSGSLLLNLEGPFTILLGVALFREHLPRQAMIGAVTIFAGASLLGVGVGEARADWLGIVLIGAACAAWALDNNLTQSLTLRDPRSIVRIKAGAAGTVNVALAVVVGEHLPEAGILAAALALGAVSYGLSVYLDALALRSLGAAAKPRSSPSHRLPARCSRRSSSRNHWGSANSPPGRSWLWAWLSSCASDTSTSTVTYPSTTIMRTSTTSTTDTRTILVSTGANHTHTPIVTRNSCTSTST